MYRLRKRMRVFLPLLAVLVAATAFCQQVRKTRTATITAKTMELDWDKNVVDFAGNCKLTVGGDYDATMTAPSMTASFTSQPVTVKTLVAKGPVVFTVITRPDGQGRKRKIVASARNQATYSEETQVVKLTGQAVADLTPLDEKDPVEAVHFTGETITASLKTNRLTVDDANLTIKGQMQ